MRLLKIDVEGADLLVLKGPANLLSQAYCDYVVMETGIHAKRFGKTARETVARLYSHGYVHLYRFLEPPYLAPLSPGEWATLNDNICASTSQVSKDLLKTISTLEKKNRFVVRKTALEV